MPRTNEQLTPRERAEAVLFTAKQLPTPKNDILVEFARDVLALLAEVERKDKALRLVEWSQDVYPSCHICAHFKNHGHALDCELGALLAPLPALL